MHQLIEEKARAFQRAIAAGVEPYPGVVELIRSLAVDIPLALCSGALPGDIQPILAQLGIAALFNVVVTAADVQASKPDPASYLLSVSRLAAAFLERNLAIVDPLFVLPLPAAALLSGQ